MVAITEEDAAVVGEWTLTEHDVMKLPNIMIISGYSYEPYSLCFHVSAC